MTRCGTLARCAAAVLVLSAGLAHADADTQFRQQFGDAFLDHYWSLHADDAIAMGYYRDADQLPVPDAKYRASLQRFLDGSIAQLEKLSAADMRSEEHTFELQSLMRISYAVFCLKKQK